MVLPQGIFSCISTYIPYRDIQIETQRRKERSEVAEWQLFLTPPPLTVKYDYSYAYEAINPHVCEVVISTFHG